MKILVIKMSSMGDVIHTLPAITDIARHFPNAKIDWVIEPAFSEIPTWHPNINQVIPLPFRHFIKQPFKMWGNTALKLALKQLRQESYDFVIDAQGLLKSAVVTLLSRGLRCGLDRHSAWESLACLAYQKTAAVNPKQHAIVRIRQLFSQILGYQFTQKNVDYGLKKSISTSRVKPYFIFIHSTTWITKEWPEASWRELAQIAVDNDFDVLLPWGNDPEQVRAQRIAAGLTGVTVLPRTSLTQLAQLLSMANGVVSVDTGLGHLAAALAIPTVSLYGPTNPEEIGTMGANQVHLRTHFSCAPCLQKRCNYNNNLAGYPVCFATIAPTHVWQALAEIAK
jgi:heptosyltransferase I